MELEIAKHNATTIYENLIKNPNTQFTYSKDGKLKPLGFLGRAWEKVSDYFSGGKATKERTKRVNELVMTTLSTLRRHVGYRDGSDKFAASSRWFNREGERTFKDLTKEMNKTSYEDIVSRFKRDLGE